MIFFKKYLLRCITCTRLDLTAEVCQVGEPEKHCRVGQSICDLPILLRVLFLLFNRYSSLTTAFLFTHLCA